MYEYIYMYMYINTHTQHLPGKLLSPISIGQAFYKHTYMYINMHIYI